MQPLQWAIKASPEWWNIFVSLTSNIEVSPAAKVGLLFLLVAATKRPTWSAGGFFLLKGPRIVNMMMVPALEASSYLSGSLSKLESPIMETGKGQNQRHLCPSCQSLIQKAPNTREVTKAQGCCKKPDSQAAHICTNQKNVWQKFKRASFRENTLILGDLFLGIWIACDWFEISRNNSSPLQDLSSICRDISTNNFAAGKIYAATRAELFFAVVAWKDNRRHSGSAPSVQSNCGDTSPAWRVPNSTSKCQNFAGHTHTALCATDIHGSPLVHSALWARWVPSHWVKLCDKLTSMESAQFSVRVSQVCQTYSCAPHMPNPLWAHRLSSKYIYFPSSAFVFFPSWYFLSCK